MRYLIFIMATLWCFGAMAQYTKVPAHKEYKTGLKWRKDWHKRVTFYDPKAITQRLTFPDEVDLRQKAGALYPAIKNQGQCGDCYIFGSNAALEGTYALEKKIALNLSEEQVLSCNGQYNCGGGYFDVMNFFVSPGVTLTSNMPYVGHPQRCPQGLPVAGKAAQWLFVGNTDQVTPTDDQLRYVLQYKPLVVTVSADSNFMDYSGGVFEGPSNLGTNHMVSLVGYASDNEGLYYILKNSWGTSWGENGYMRIRPRANNLAEAAAFVRLP